MGKSEEGIVTSVGSIGDRHDASDDRSCSNRPRLYTSSRNLEQDWQEFWQQSEKLGRRRTMMRTFITYDVLHSTSAPIEAVIPVGRKFLVYLGENRHWPISTNQRTDVPGRDLNLRLNQQQYRLDTQVSMDDTDRLIQLWTQFGWTRQGVETFINAGTTPVVLIRDLQDQLQVVGAMIAESLQFGDVLLVELTEMAVAPQARGQHLASVLIRELTSQVQAQVGEHALIYGEYNMSTGAHRAASRAGNQVGSLNRIRGVLADHVGIVVDPNKPNHRHPRWDTRWLHNFLVMYHPVRASR